MAVFCWSCGTSNPDEIDLCVRCGESIGAPALQKLGTSSPRSEHIPATEYIPANNEWTLLGDEPPSGRTLERSREQSAERARPKRGGRNWLAIIGMPVVVASAIVGGLLYQSPVGGVIEVGPQAGAYPDGGTQYCTIVDSMGSAWPGEGMWMGNDQFASLAGSSGVASMPFCVIESPNRLHVTYEIPIDQQASIIEGYGIWLQRNDGFTASHINGKGGQFWRRSVDSGQWLYLQISVSSTEVTVTVDKGGREVVPDEAISATSKLPPSVTNVLKIGEHETLVLTPVPGWEQYPVYLPGFANEYLSQYLRYNKITGYSAVGTLEAYVFDMRYETYTHSLPDAAAYWMRAFDPSIRESVIADGEQTTVAGAPAMRYTMQQGDSLTTYVFIQARTTLFAIVAETDATSPDPLAEVDAMINSAHLTG